MAWIKSAKERARAEAESSSRAAAEARAEAGALRAALEKEQFERRKDAVVLRMAPRLQASMSAARPRAAGKKRQGPSGTEMLRSLEREIGAWPRSNKASILLTKAVREVDSMEVRLAEGAEREEELLQLLVEHLAPEALAAIEASAGSTERGVERVANRVRC